MFAINIRFSIARLVTDANFNSIEVPSRLSWSADNDLNVRLIVADSSESEISKKFWFQSLPNSICFPESSTKSFVLNCWIRNLLLAIIIQCCPIAPLKLLQNLGMFYFLIFFVLLLIFLY